MTDLPRVLLCGFDVVPSATGSSWRLTESLKALAPSFQVVALTLKPPDLTHVETYHGARLFRVPLGGGELEGRLQTFGRAVRRQLESEEYALVLFTDPFAGQVLSEQRASKGYRLVYDATYFPSTELAPDGLSESDGKRFLSRLRRQELACLMSADAVLTGSPLTRTFLESVGVSPNAVHVLRTPSPLAFVPAPLPSAGEELRLGYLGSAEPWQGLEVLLEGIAQAQARLPVRLLISGVEHPTHTARLKAHAHSLGLSPETIRFETPLRRDGMAKPLTEIDIGVLPLAPGERNEVRGAALAKVSDYLAAGRGVLAADLPAARALLNEQVAVFFEAGNAAALADSLVALGRSPETRIQLGLAARVLAEQEVGIVRFSRALRQLVCALLGIPLPASQKSEDSEDRTQVHPDFDDTLRRLHSVSQDEDYTQLQPEDGTSLQGPGTDPAALPPDLPTYASSLLPEIPSEAVAPVPDLAIDPWQALVLHGYCPPPTSAFSRPPPPTTFPGKGERGPRPPSLPSMPAIRSKP